MSTSCSGYNSGSVCVRLSVIYMLISVKEQIWDELNTQSRSRFTKNAREVSSSGKGDLGFIIHTKLMLAHSASRFMQQIGKKRTRLKFQHPNFACFDALQGKKPSMTFKIGFRGLSKLHVFLMGDSPA